METNSINISFSIVIGVISGVLTTMLIFFIGFVFKKFLIPWYQSITYRGLDISGQWEYEMKHSNGSDAVTMNLRQKGHNITGKDKAIVIDNKGKHTKGMAFKIRGLFFDGYLIAYLISENRKERGCGSLTLQVIKAGLKMEGYISYYDVEFNCVTSKKIICIRK